ncbi:MAG: hypothetical protein HOG33_06935 [Candidatus Marinimicrobia bacterium]|jgi:L-ascorbate metabolism protein UlaG (beta-lactamase superfamily)|nr:hypothetical protein [Candidatus Neomarinimicrobiota bacterium]MBT4784854.1 hypothetical protein [Candidatus Neomarinimicrobiota bacterium]|tara:strand:- start:610 stop:1593 length:984 start_codon:yes stop_codon:yes gene_type:complete
MIKKLNNKLSIPFIIILLFFSYGCETSQSSKSNISLKYLGAAGWEILSDTSTVLIDPYLSRIKLVGNSTTKNISNSAAARDWGKDQRPKFYRDDEYEPDTLVINEHISSADYIFVHHTHFDHAADVPYIAKKTGAKVIGTESLSNLLRAHGVPNNQIITVKGGEDYVFDNFSVKVLPSLHSALRKKLYFNSESIQKGIKVPLKIKQYVEGNSLMYYFRFKNHKVLTMGSMNFIGDAIEGLEPNILLAGSANSRKEIYNYTERLLSLTNYPDIIIPTHWDDFRVTYDASQEAAIKSKAAPFIEDVKNILPNAEIILPKHLEPMVFESK